MREIKFRAWDGELMLFVEPKANVDEDEMIMDWNILFDANRGVTLMQYTGLKDKNSKEIYEGDVCRVQTWVDEPNIYKVHPNLFKVEYMDDCDRAAFELYSEDGMWGKFPDGSPIKSSQYIDLFLKLAAQEHDIEIIGNI